MQMKLTTALALLPFLVQASPAPAVNGKKIALSKRSSLAKDGVANIGAIQSHVGAVQGKVARGFTNYQKNTGNIHPNFRNSTVPNKRSTGTEPLTDENSQLWQGSIEVGSPAVTFIVDFDTGSSDLFLPGSDCDSTCSGHTIYDTSASSTAQDVGQTFSLSFGDGSTVTGEQFTDTVSIANLTATSQTLGAASQYSSSLAVSSFSPDGLMGMAYQSISQYNASPVFQSLVTQGQTTAGEFGFTLLASGSELFLGGVDTSKFSGSLAYTDVTQQGFWQVELGGASVGSQQVVSNVDAVVDTGTSLVIGDSTNVGNIYAAIPGSQDASSTLGEGFFTFPCSSAPSNVALTLGGQDFTISADTINLGQVEQGSEDCVGGIIADDSQGFWILGDVFLSNVYTSFDLDNNRVGFASVN